MYFLISQPNVRICVRCTDLQRLGVWNSSIDSRSRGWEGEIRWGPRVPSGMESQSCRDRSLWSTWHEPEFDRCRAELWPGRTQKNGVKYWNIVSTWIAQTSTNETVKAAVLWKPTPKRKMRKMKSTLEGIEIPSRIWAAEASSSGIINWLEADTYLDPLFPKNALIGLM